MEDHNKGQPVFVELEFTPNPNTLKYSVNRTLCEKGAVNCLNKEDAEKKSPLAAKLLDVPGIAAVMIGKTFVTVTKTEEGDWDLVHRKSSEIIEAHVGSGEPCVLDAAFEVASSGGGDIEAKIRDILDREIRPAVAMDGGDITLDRFEAGIVYLYMQGSCAGCPSSTMTLKMGIETKLREAIPEVLEVVSL